MTQTLFPFVSAPFENSRLEMEKGKRFFSEGCGTEASTLLTCLSQDDYTPEKCADLFFRFRRCAIELRITEFGLVHTETTDLPSLEP